MEAFGGLWKSIPLFGSLLLTVILASVGLPGLSAFPGEFTLLVGVFQESAVAAAFATLGIVLGAWYMLNFFRYTFAGPLDRAENRTLPDLGRRESIILLPLVLFIFLVGILPNLIFYSTDASVDLMLDRVQSRQVATGDPTGDLDIAGPIGPGGSR